MPHAFAYLPLLLAAAPVLGQEAARSAPARPQGERMVAQLRVQQRVVIRVPRMMPGREPLDAPPVRWIEKKGPKCVPLAGLEGASLSGRNTVDLISSGGDRVRAQLGDDCSPMDFYSGFYLKGTQDGLVCADRDVIRMRSGGICRIERFRKLTTKR